MTGIIEREWNGHRGTVVASANGFDVIECQQCGFKHIVSIPTEDELENAYRHEYYTQEKPLYIDRYKEDLEWWNTVYTHRYEVLEQHLLPTQRKILDIGSGPGFFLLNGEKRGWQVKGVEPSEQAAKHSKSLGLDIENIFFTEQSAPAMGTFDAINMGEVLEHIPQPIELLRLVHARLNPGGMVCLVVPNDFNPFQLALRDHMGFNSWWVAPPHHINYFDFKSLAGLVERCGFEVVHQEATFPIDMFLLMGDDYVNDNKLGRACHKKRMKFEGALNLLGGEVLHKLYRSFADQGVGREIVLFMKQMESK